MTDIAESNQQDRPPVSDFNALALTRPRGVGRLNRFDRSSNAWVEQCITSPNVNYIVEPVRGERTVRVRGNGGLGEDDHTLWPQTLCDQYAYHACILRRPACRTDPRQIIWWLPGRDGFTEIPGSIVDGLGTLARDILIQFQTVQQPLTARVKAFLRRPEVPNFDMGRLTVLSFLDISARHTLARLETVPMPYNTYQRTVREYQRFWLETQAWLDYRDAWNARLNNTEYEGLEVEEQWMGAFTANPKAVAHLRRLGAPVWYVRDYPLPSWCEVVEESAWRPIPLWMKTEDDRQPEPYPVLYKGQTGMPAQYHNIHAFAAAYVDFANPLDYKGPDMMHQDAAPFTHAPPPPALPAPDISSSSSQRYHPYVAPSQSQSRSSTKQYDLKDQGPNFRSKWSDLPDPAIPPAVPAWAQALLAVNADHKRCRQDVATQPQCYALPEPALLLSPQDPIKRARYVGNWLRARSMCMYKSANSCGELPPIVTQAWRDLLNWSATKVTPPAPHVNQSAAPSKPSKKTKKTKVNIPAGQTYTQMRKDKLAALFGPAIEHPLLQLSQSTKIFWAEREMIVNGTGVIDLDPGLLKEIIWDLFEHNFRLELCAIDFHLVSRFAMTPEEKRLRQDNLFTCWGQDSLLLAGRPDTTVGLSAHNIQDRLPSLQAFGRLLSKWPGCPAPIVKGDLAREAERSDIALADFELALAKFYTQKFWDIFARPAIIPHLFIPAPA